MGLMADNPQVNASMSGGNGNGGSMMAGGMSAIVGAMSDQWNNQQNLSNNKKLMNRQALLNEKMARANQLRNKEMWDYTNYENQVKHLENAGLNKALMYGGSGGGGTTASGGSGSGVGLGSAPVTNSATMMAMSNMKELALMDAQRENIEADTENKKADSTLKGGQTENVGANTALTKLQSENQEVLNRIQSTTEEQAIDTIIANYNKAEGEASSAVSAGKYAEERNKAEVYKLQQEGMLTAIKISAEKAGIKLTEEQTRAISQELAQGWEELYQKGRANDNQAGMVNIAGFKAKADYAIDKANVDLRAKEVMIRGAEAFVNGISKNRSRSSSTTEETFNDGEGGRTTHKTTKYK